ncbi:hypothetical protein C8Q79DRAFT_1119866 [Trametes meyenii]|nr:hypothetical protein C8Q79DRAFT_1119866 [Trametes meyenii]
MSSFPDTNVVPLQPISHTPTATIESSPHKHEKANNHDPSKHGLPLPDATKYDRKIQGASSMGHTVIVDFSEFEMEVMVGSGRRPHRIPVPDANDKMVRFAFKQLYAKNERPLEDHIAETMVNVINKQGLCKGYTAALSRYSYNITDTSKGKVDAALYRGGRAPDDGRPDWTHVRLYIEFKRGGTSLDPFDDDDGDSPEPTAAKRAAARSQITAYTRTTFLYQHRNALYSLFVNGQEFRVLRWDRSGVVVTKKLNYVEDPTPLLRFLIYFARLSDSEQGIDVTATLLTPGSKALALMAEFAEDDPSDMPYEEDDLVPAWDTTKSTSTSAEASNEPQASSSSSRKGKARAKKDPESYLDDVEPSDGSDPRVFSYVRKRFRESLVADWPHYKLEVGPEKRPFLVGMPVYFSSSMFGRGTRGYIALDVQSRRFVFLKDSWRPFYEGVEPEGHYLQMMSSEDEVSIPRLLVHGDVQGDFTFTAPYAQQRYNKLRAAHREAALERARAGNPQSNAGATSSESAQEEESRGKKRSSDHLDDAGEAHDEESDAESNDDDETGLESRYFRHYTHYRIAVKDVCLSFAEIKSSAQLVTMIYDCMSAHHIAYRDHSLLHRDISAGNVIIRPTLVDDPQNPGMKKVMWNGVLTDWELAKVVPKDGSQQRARQPERTGTWQFMSVAYVKYHPAPVTVADEIESFFHVLLFYAVRLLNHNIESVPAFVVAYFDTHVPKKGRGQRTCSDLKTSTMKTGELLSNSAIVRFYVDSSKKILHAAFESLLATFLRCFRARYKVALWSDYVKQTEQSRLALLQQNSTSTSHALRLRRLAPPTLRPLHFTAAGFPSVKEPSDNTRMMAARLDDHTEMLNDIWHCVSTPVMPADGSPGFQWPRADAVADRLSNSGYDPRPNILALEELEKNIKAHESANLDGPPPLKKMKTSVSGSVEPQAELAVQRATDGILTRGPLKKRDRKGKARA